MTNLQDHLVTWRRWSSFYAACAACGSNRLWSEPDGWEARRSTCRTWPSVEHLSLHQATPHPYSAPAMATASHAHDSRGHRSQDGSCKLHRSAYDMKRAAAYRSPAPILMQPVFLVPLTSRHEHIGCLVLVSAFSSGHLDCFYRGGGCGHISFVCLSVAITPRPERLILHLLNMDVLS